MRNFVRNNNQNTIGEYAGFAFCILLTAIFAPFPNKPVHPELFW